MSQENNKQQAQPQPQTVSQFCYNLATVLDAAIVDRNREIIEGAMSNAEDLKNLQHKVLDFASKLQARHNAMGAAPDNVLQKYLEFFGIQQEQPTSQVTATEAVAQ